MSMSNHPKNRPNVSDAVRSLLFALALAILIFFNQPVRAANYTFTIIAKTGDDIAGKTLTGVGFAPVINSAGTVAFVGSFSGGEGIFTDSKLLVQTGDSIGGKRLTLGCGGVGPPRTFGSLANSDRTVVFQACFEGGIGIFTPSESIAVNGDTIGGKTLTAVYSPTINDRGAVVFVGALSAGTGLFTQSGLLVQTGDIIGGKLLGPSTFEGPRINEGGTIVFRAFFDGGTGIFTPSQLVAASGDTIGGKILTDAFSPAINDLGAVAFGGRFPGGEGVFTPSGVVAATGDTIGGRTLSAAGFPPSTTAVQSPSLVSFPVEPAPSSQASSLRRSW